MKAREWALQVLNDVIDKGAYANIALDRQHRKYPLTGPERGFAVELTRGTIKAWGTLDWMLQFYLSRPLKDIPAPICNILRMGFFQLFFMEKIPPSAACNEAVELAKKYGHAGTAGLVNGVLRTALRSPEKIQWPNEDQDPASYLARKYYHPVWLVKEWISELGIEECRELLEFNNLPPVLALRTNTLKTSREQIMSKLTDEGFQLEISPWTPEGIRALLAPPLGSSYVLRSGEVIIQDEGAMIIPHLLEPQAGERVLDACSAPGGKTTHIAQLMENKGEIIALDIHDHKLLLIQDNARKLGIDIIKPLLGDAANLPAEMGKFDRILADVPCSGLGTIQRRADTRWRKSLHTIKDLPKLQMDILNSCAIKLKPGGRLVYSTCTLTRSENEDIIESFLENHPEFSLIPADTIYPLANGEFLKLWPHRSKTDGFFAACLTKKEGVSS